MSTHVIITDKTRTKGGNKLQGVGVMIHKELNLHEIEDSHTLGGLGEGRVQSSRGEGSGEKKKKNP